MTRVLASLPLLLIAFAGCVDEPVKDAGGDAPALDQLLKARETPLWPNPQNFPHPAFGYPTLTNPAVGANVSTWWLPIPAKDLPSHIGGIELAASTMDDVPAGAGMALFGSIAVVPGFGEPTSVLNVSDPLHPTVLSTLDEDASHRNVDFIAYPTGRLVAVLSTGNGILPVWDLTDPTHPERIAEMNPTTGTHKVNIVPGTPIVYNANSNGGGSNLPGGGTGVTEIFDLTDPEKPKHVMDWQNGYGCHHIYFYIKADEDYYRAICAGIEVTQLWDIKDPLKPVVKATIPVHEGNPALPSTSVSFLRFSHFAILNQDHSVLIVGDETGGGGVPPGCDAHVQVGETGASGPLGNLYFYDITDEQNPVLKGWISPNAPIVDNPPSPGGGFGDVFYSCTAHHGRLVPDPEGRDLLAHAFYRAGVVLVDFTDPSMPFIVDQFSQGTDTWEVWYYNGYLFTGDLARGLDVLTFT